MEMLSTVLLLLVGFAALLVFMGVQMVSQSREYVVERLGRYDRTLKAGFNFIVPVLERVAHRVDVLERQISPQPERISIITKDNVTVKVNAVLRAITRKPGMRASAVVMSSVIPSDRYCCAGSPLMLSSGSTARISGFLPSGSR